jgi:uncharacterized protein (TIGR02117 family)
MGIIRKIGKLVLVLALAGLVAGFWTSRPNDPALFPPANKADCVKIHLSDTGWHTGLIIAATDLQAATATLPQGNMLGQVTPLYGNVTHFEFGWGDREFYMSGTNEIGGAARALLLPGEAVLHVVGLDRAPAEFFNADTLTELHLSRAGLVRMVAGLDASFTRTPEGPRVLRQGLYGTSAFFPAEGTFHLARTCNGWTASRLSEAGLPHLPALATHSAPLLWHLKNFAAPRSDAVCG